MASKILSNVITRWRPLRSYLTAKSPLCKSPQLPCTAWFSSFRGSGPTYGQGRKHQKTTGHKQNELWSDLLDGARRPPKSVFAAGTAKKATEMLKRKSPLSAQDEKELEGNATGKKERLQAPARPLSIAEWRNLRESVEKPWRFEIKMMREMHRAGVKLEIAKSLLTFVAVETGTLTYELLLHYLMICVRDGSDDEVSDVYQIMRESFSDLETGASSILIKYFSGTAKWRESLKILQDVKKIVTPSPSNYGHIIKGAMVHGHMTTAWALYDELIETGMTPNPETWDSLFKGVTETSEVEVETMSDQEHQERLLGLLHYMRNNQIYPQYSLATSIKSWFESLREENWTGSWTSGTPNGLCKCCGSELETIQLSDDEYQQLKDRVMTYVIQGKDVFKNTTPEEVECFKRFVKTRPPFDVVIDGLNVGNATLKTLLAVVTELKSLGLNILVLGRKHMRPSHMKRGSHYMETIQQIAHCFFTDNISEDDPFLLYATLNSGNQCLFVSKDLMRDHKARLPDGATRRLFFKWQRGHQLVLNYRCIAPGRRIQFHEIPRYDAIIQTSGDSWHIPYDESKDRTMYEVPQQWLCVTRRPGGAR